MQFLDRSGYVPCHLDVGWYVGTGNIFINVIAQYDDGDSVYCSLTTLPNKNEVLPYGYGYLNPMFPRGESFIQEYNLGQPTGRQVYSGVNICPQYKFNLDILLNDYDSTTSQSKKDSISDFTA